MSQHDPTGATRDAEFSFLNTVSDDAESRCPTSPEFEESDGTTRVRMNCDSYVRLLVGARETDPDVWPPGLEVGAALVERVRQIEDDCIALHGEFDPHKLPRAAQDEYMNIHLTLDELQESAGLDKYRFSQQQTANRVSAATPIPDASWQEFPHAQSSENFA